MMPLADGLLARIALLLNVNGPANAMMLYIRISYFCNVIPVNLNALSSSHMTSSKLRTYGTDARYSYTSHSFSKLRVVVSFAFRMLHKVTWVLVLHGRVYSLLKL